MTRQLTNSFLRELANFRRSILGEVDQRISRIRASTNVVRSKDIRVGITAAVDATYPTEASGANVFEVNLGKPSFTETVGVQSLTFTSYSPVKTRICRTMHGGWLAEGTVVFVEKHHGQYYIKPFAATSTKVLTDIQVDGPNKLLQYKSRDAYVFWDGAESAWTTFHTGEDQCSGA